MGPCWPCPYSHCVNGSTSSARAAAFAKAVSSRQSLRNHGGSISIASLVDAAAHLGGRLQHHTGTMP